MDKITAWLQDKKNLPIVIGVGVALVVLLIFMLMSGRNRGPRQVATGPGGMMGGQGMMGAGGAGMMGAGGAGMMGGQGMPGAGMMGQQGGMMGQQQAMVPAAPKSKPPVEKIRANPFAPSEGSGLTAAQRIAIEIPRQDWFRQRPSTQVAVGPPPVETLPNVRMAGLLWGDRVTAVLDWGGDMRIVRPGNRVDGWRVERIERNGMWLRQGNRRARVNLQASGSGVTGVVGGAGGAGMPGAGGPGAPGGMMGMPGGMMGGRGPGGAGANNNY